MSGARVDAGASLHLARTLSMNHFLQGGTRRLVLSALLLAVASAADAHVFQAGGDAAGAV